MDGYMQIQTLGKQGLWMGSNVSSNVGFVLVLCLVKWVLWMAYRRLLQGIDMVGRQILT